MTVYREVKFFDLDTAPDYIRDSIRPIALAHVSAVDGTAIWEITVGTHDWQGTGEEGSLNQGRARIGAKDA